MVLLSVLLIALLLVGDRNHLTSGKPFVPCPVKDPNLEEKRQLFVATCDNRVLWKSFNAMKLWNVTGNDLREKYGLHMINVCYGVNWGQYGYLTKPLNYLAFLKNLLEAKVDRGAGVYVILMDSDTFWSARDLKTIWNKFDCARGEKEMVLSTEMSCWVGRYCTQEDLYRWYNGTENSTTFSPFANSGVLMGEVNKVIKMLQYVVDNKDKYFIKYFKVKFDDQYALADYAITVAPEDVALDISQQLLASCSIHAPADPPEDGWPFVCKQVDGKISRSCIDYTKYMMRHGYFSIDKDTCLASRALTGRLKLYTQLETLAPDPIIWHGNGVGKGACLHLGWQSFKCFLTKRNMTEGDYEYSKMGYDR